MASWLAQNLNNHRNQAHNLHNPQNLAINLHNLTNHHNLHNIADQPAQPSQPSQPAKPSDQPAQPSQPSQPAYTSDQPFQPSQPSTEPAQPSDQPSQPSGENNQSTNETKEIIELPEPRGDKERTKNSRKSKIGFSGIALLGENQVDLANNNDELAVKFRYSVIFKDDESNPVTIETGNIPNNAGLKLIVKIDSDGNLIFSPSKKPELRPPLLSSYKDNNKVVKEVKEYTVTHVEIKGNWLEIQNPRKIVVNDFLKSALKIVDTYKKDNKLYIEFNNDLSKFELNNLLVSLVERGAQYDPLNFKSRINKDNVVNTFRTKKDQEINFNILEIDLTQDFRNKNNGKDVLLLNITLSNDDSTYNFDLKRASRTDVVVEL
ncbi:hypothetical protein MCANUFG1_01093 [Mycoplasmopsis canis UFG1]|uniref:hypothetical protein n=1 Tax=Mycoplasmopsis canis TaxID=29555 RepID=UPI00025AF7C1|nr:hypothetical protein [Mycoplasmopsis canis]EIE41995.1 hypothetical protein MCANUFG1_01093 [Mycoplasmopsis canis UFG1]